MENGYEVGKITLLFLSGCKIAQNNILMYGQEQTERGENMTFWIDVKQSVKRKKRKKKKRLVGSIDGIKLIKENTSNKSANK